MKSSIVENTGKNTGAGFHFPTPGHLSDPGIRPTSLAFAALAGRTLTTEPPGKPLVANMWVLKE